MTDTLLPTPIRLLQDASAGILPDSLGGDGLCPPGFRCFTVCCPDLIFEVPLDIDGNITTSVDEITRECEVCSDDEVDDDSSCDTLSVTSAPSSTSSACSGAKLSTAKPHKRSPPQACGSDTESLFSSCPSSVPSSRASTDTEYEPEVRKKASRGRVRDVLPLPKPSSVSSCQSIAYSSTDDGAAGKKIARASSTDTSLPNSDKRGRPSTEREFAAEFEFRRPQRISGARKARTFGDRKFNLAKWDEPRPVRRQDSAGSRTSKLSVKVAPSSRD